ncbi:MULTISPECIES: glutamyl-tRNA reductase [unclassified Kocuria]|uniref:glutamyl-tRNA reductase n=1 Tax=unclassified Kocuria TaxID=2649579 RepID=UPI000649B14B|nr:MULTISPECIES: glutamyl-tRNA reductase [unclassified Kocuria]KLU09738.1 glutamyl-tRNA reductase [Kocuria sp. SM24M-10]OLT05242.1 glutamyl-tRNA reductase [Kocuria sp. CNJ-770]
MVLFALVASHQNVDLNTVARLSTGALGLSEEMVGSGRLQGAVTLSTCNRLELYGELEPAPGASPRAALDEVLSELAEQIGYRSGLDPEFVTGSLRVFTDSGAARHLFTVVSGLESAVVGEREITGQVRRALNDAQQAGTVSGRLLRLFEAAARTARKIGTQTALGERGRSIVSVALDLADDVTAGTWASRRALVFGTGAYAGATMAALRDRGCADIEVFSGSGRAEQFTQNRGGTPVEPAGLPAALERADVVIGCSGGSSPMGASALPAGPRTVVDLALTRDFDPAVADLPGVDLITLESVRLAAPEETRESVEAATGIVEHAAQEFAASQDGRDMDAAIVALRRHTMAVLDAELEKVTSHHGCTAAKEQIELAMRRMVRSLLHTPTVRARELAAQGRQDEYITGLEALYGIEVPAAPAERTASPAPAPAAEIDHRPKAAG